MLSVDFIISAKLRAVFPKMYTLSLPGHWDEHVKHFEVLSTILFGVSIDMITNSS